ncbi:glycoside hydrolase family 2 TIM barrel-domain containing protein [Prevotella merdae]|uniref:glycoside hydrolase family 2 TIM barrel-domain containing protein n=1 Tax=Prevotella merdae TaxID=2079531 RepID=UPI000D0F0501|nr:glycoside hydrolase family 2 TIM barrel-domain containing protein [Prevotella merdae]
MKKLLFLILLVLSTGRVYAALIDSLHVTPSIDEQTFKNGKLDITFWNQGNSMVTYCLMDADGEVVAEGKLVKQVKPARQQFAIDVQKVKRWTAETPYQYTLYLNATPIKGRGLAEQVKQKVGFRLVAIRYAKLFLNGCPLFLKGINLHNLQPNMSRADMIDILRLLKAHNINAVCTDRVDPLWYDLCDEYGFYACVELGRSQHIAAFKQLYNHPSIIMWSVGKAETDNVVISRLFETLKQEDTKRPVIWVDMPFTDKRCELYAPFAPTAKVADDFCNMGNPVAEKPQLLASYAQPNGNSYGAIDEYMSLRYRQPKYAGGFLCEGTLANMQAATPAMQEIRYQMQSISTLSHAPRIGRLEVFNDSFYDTLSNVYIRWVVRHNGVPIKNGVYTKPFSVAPRKTTNINLGFTDLFKTYPKGELTLDVSYHQAIATELIAKDQEQAKAQITVRPFKPSVEPLQASMVDKRPLKLKRGQSIVISNTCCTVAFDKTTGWLTRYDVNGQKLLAEGGTLKPTFWRALTNNDRAANGEKQFAQWEKPTYTLVALKTEKVKSNSTQRTDICVTAQYELKEQNVALSICYTINEGGVMKVEQTVTPNDETAVPLALRYGMTLQMPVDMCQSEYFGRGPLENYADRKASQFVGQYKYNVTHAQCPYIPYQAWGNHCDVRYWRQTNALGLGLEVSSAITFGASAYLAKTLPSAIDLHIDLKQSGVNEMVNVGQYPEMITDTRVLLHKQTFTFWLNPIMDNVEKY